MISISLVFAALRANVERLDPILATDQAGDLAQRRHEIVREHGQCIQKAREGERKCLALLGQLDPEAYTRKIINDRTAFLNQGNVGSEQDRVFEAVVDSITSEEARTLADLREGAFCSRCNKSRTQLGGEAAFAQHIRDVKGERVSASPEVIRAAEKMFQEQIFFWTKRSAEFRQAYAIRADSAAKSGFLASEWSKFMGQEKQVRVSDCERELTEKQKIIVDYFEKVRALDAQIAEVKLRIARKKSSEAKRQLAALALQESSTKASYTSSVAQYDAIYDRHNSAYCRCLFSADEE